MHCLSASDLHNKKALIFGLGETGLSVAQTLHRKHIDFTIFDDDPSPEMHALLSKDMPDVDIRSGASNTDCFDEADYIVVSPGIALDVPALQSAQERGVPIIGDIELFALWVERGAKLVAVTGSNGKTTVVSLLTQMIEASGIRVCLGGNIGTPALSMLDENPDVYVLELSSFQLETTFSMKPSVSAVLNVSEDHLDRYTSMQAYRAAKMRIHNGSEHIVANRCEAVASVDVALTSFGLDKGEAGHFGLLQSGADTAIACGEDIWLDCRQLALSGESGILNVQACFAIGKALGLAKEAMVGVAKTFQGLPHRLQAIGSTQQVDWVNDSKATNTGAVLNALRSIDKPTILICGGVGKGSDFSKLAETIAQKAKAVIVMGRDGNLIADALADASPLHRVASMHEAVALAQKLSAPGDCVLLSPACASFDMYQNYSERGEDFISEYKAITSH